LGDILRKAVIVAIEGPAAENGGGNPKDGKKTAKKSGRAS
jgi:hypothetical protein